jgi:vanillate O-demethylase monooxygenase subunit
MELSHPYLLNCWYVASWASELAPGARMRRVLLAKPVLLMRSEGGAVAAISNICPHRFASLSEGRFEAGIVQCPYHGLRFDMTGRCVHNPHGEGKIPERAYVPSYPIAERYGAIWIWPGSPDLADPKLIPDFSFLDAPSRTARAGGHLVTKANYQLLCDNILDLSHADFIHGTTLSTEGETARSHPKSQVDGDIVNIKWSFEGKGIVMNRSTSNPQDVHTDLEVTWHAPGAMILRSESHPIGDEGSKLSSVSVHKRVAAHIMTPETEHSTHYFFDVSDRRHIERATQIFESEDGVVLEDIQRNMGNKDFWEMVPLILSNDRGGVLARRVLQRKIRHEQAGVNQTEQGAILERDREEPGERTR